MILRLFIDQFITNDKQKIALQSNVLPYNIDLVWNLIYSLRRYALIWINLVSDMKNYRTKTVLTFVYSLVKAVFVDDELELMSLLFIKQINITSIPEISISLKYVSYKR